MSKIDPQKLIIKQLQLAEKARAQQRLDVGLKKFFAGEDELILQDETLQRLMAKVAELPKNQDIILRITQCLSNEDIAVRKRAISLLALCLTRSPSIFIQSPILVLLEQWFEKENEFFTELAVFVKSVLSMIALSMNIGKPQLTEPLLSVLASVASGKLFKEHRIKNEIVRALDSFVTIELLTKLWTSYRLAEAEQRDILHKVFPSLGTKAGKYLLRQMMHSQQRIDRLLVVNLLGSFDIRFHNTLVECLSNSPPWFVVRNVLRVIAELEAEMSEEDFCTCLSYKDKRVQDELVRTIIKLGGRQMAGRLLRVLPTLKPETQVEVIITLVGFDDPEVFAALIEFMEANLNTLIHHENILLMLCDVLEKSPTIEGETLLRQLKVEASSNPQLARLNHFVGKSLAFVSPFLRHEQNVEEIPENIRFDTDPADLVLVQKKMRELLSGIEKTNANMSAPAKAKTLCKLGLRFFDEKDIPLAQALLDKALEVDPNGYQNFQVLADKIEGDIDYYGHYFLELEKIFLDILTAHEREVLREYIEFEEYRTGENLTKVGEINPALYFVFEGELHVSCTDNGKNVFLKKMGVGDSLGHGLFFNAALWGERVIATMPTMVGVLSFWNFEELQLDEPELFEKLEEYCNAQHQIPNLVSGAGAERRKHARFSPPIKAKLCLVNHLNNTASYPLSVQLENISASGAAISVCLSDQKNVHTFLGTEVNISFTLAETAFTTPAYIVAVRWVNDNTFSIHMQFLQLLDPQLLQGV